MVAVSDMHTVPSIQLDLENPMVDDETEAVCHLLQDSMAAVHGSQLLSGSQPPNSTVESDGFQAIPSLPQTPVMEAQNIPCSFIPHIYQSSTAKVNTVTSLVPTVRQISRQEMEPLELNVSFDITPLATSTPVGSESFLMDGSKDALSAFVTSPINIIENSSGKATCTITDETCGIPHTAHDSVLPSPSLYTSENIMGAVERIRVGGKVCTITEPEQSSTVERIAPTVFTNVVPAQCSVLLVDFDTSEQMMNIPVLHPSLQKMSEVNNTASASYNVSRDGNQFPPEVRARTGYSSLEDIPHADPQISETGHELQSDVSLDIETADLHLLSSDIHEKYNASKEVTLDTCLVDSIGFTEQHNSESYTAPSALQNEGAQVESIPTTVPTITAHISHSDVSRSFVSSSSPSCKGETQTMLNSGILRSCKPGVETGTTVPLASLKTSVSEEESPAPIHLVPTLCSEELDDSQIPPHPLTKLTAVLEAKLEVSTSKVFPPSKLQEKADDVSQHQSYVTCTSSTNERDCFYSESGVESEDVSLAEDALLACDSDSMVFVGQLHEEQMTVCKEGLNRRLLSDVSVMQDGTRATGNPELNVHMDRTRDNMPSPKEQMSGSKCVISRENSSITQGKSMNTTKELPLFTSNLAKSAVPSLEYNVVADNNRSDLTEENTVLSSCDVPRVTLNQEGVLDTDSNGEQIVRRTQMEDERGDTGFGQVDISLKSAQPGKASLPCGTEGQSDVGTNITGQGALAGLSSVDDSVQLTTEDTTTNSEGNAVTYVSNLQGRRDVKFPLSDSKQTPGGHLVVKTIANIGLDDRIFDEKNIKDIVTRGGVKDVSENTEANQTQKNTTRKELVNSNYSKATVQLTTSRNTCLDHKVGIVLDDREDRRSQLSSSNIPTHKPNISSDKLLKPESRIIYGRSNITGFTEQFQPPEDLQISSEEKSISPRDSNEVSLQSSEIDKVLNDPTSRMVTTTRSQESVGSIDQKSPLPVLILGRPLPPSSVRGIAGESSKSSPQLHSRQNTKNLSKKSVSWTDLKGCGALEMEVSEDIRTEECVRPVLHFKSIMKKPNLSPIAPTPPPPTPPTPPCSILPQPTSPPVISPQPSHIVCDDTSIGAESSEDDIPLPRSNLKEFFSLQLPQHIRGHGNRSSAPPNDAPDNSRIGKPLDGEAHTADISVPEVLEISQPFTTSKTSSFSSTLSVSKTLSFSSPLVDKKTSEASSSSFSKPYRVSLSLGNSLSTEDNSSSGFSQYSDVSASSNISLCSGVSPNSRATSSSGVSCSGFSSSGAVSSPGGVSPLQDASATTGVIPSCEILQSNNTAMLGHITSSPVSNLNMSARKQKSHNIYVSSSVLSTPAETMQVAPSSKRTFSAPTTPSGEAASVMKQNISRCRSEGDLVMPSVEGISDTWTALSKVMQEAGTILKTLSETSQVLHQKIVSPHHKASLPPVIEEGTGVSSIVGTTGGRKVSVAVQTDQQHYSNVKTRSMDAQTSFESMSDSDSVDVRSKLPQSHYPFTSTESTCKPDVSEALNSETVISPGSKGMSVLQEIKSLRQERERINRLLGQYEFSSLHPSRSGSRVRGKSSSSDLDSPVSSLMASLQNLTHTQHEREVESEAGSYWHSLSATSKRYLAMYQRRLEDSCYQLEERLRLNARRRQLRKQMISNNHNHYPSIEDRLALHASLDFAKNPFCGQMQSPSATPYMSTASLPTVAPQSPRHSREASPCCCISPTHRPHHTHCQSPASSCSAHTHWASCHAAPAQDLSYTPHCMNSRVRMSTQQCREQLLNLRRHLVSASGLASSSSSLGDASPGRHSCRFKDIGNSFDTPYQRGHAASLSSLPRVNSISGLWRRGVSGSTASVASESEADKRRSRRRVDSDSDSGAGWSSSGTSLRHAYH